MLKGRGSASCLQQIGQTRPWTDHPLLTRVWFFHLLAYFFFFPTVQTDPSAQTVFFFITSSNISALDVCFPLSTCTVGIYLPLLSCVLGGVCIPILFLLQIVLCKTMSSNSLLNGCIFIWHETQQFFFLSFSAWNIDLRHVGTVNDMEWIGNCPVLHYFVYGIKTDILSNTSNPVISEVKSTPQLG